MKKTPIYRTFIFIFFISLLLIVYSIYQISSSKSKVKKNIESWDAKQNVSVKPVEKNNDVKEKSSMESKEESEKFEVMGKLTIVKTEYILPIVKGTSTEDLENGAGYYLDSVLPGEKGNCIIFGHRDGVFKTLEDVNEGDEIVVETSLGKFIYKIVNLKITSAEESEIIKRYNEPILTLVTCYPFNYIGTAPKRFVVTAKLK